MLPRRSGYAVCRLIKHDPLTQHAEVIFMSGFDKKETWETWTRVGADDFLNKPFSPGVMLDTARRHLRLPHAA